MATGTTGERWAAWGRWTFLLMLPLGLVLTAWAWIGRLFLGSGGWFMLVFMVSALPVLLAAGLVTWVLALAMRRRPRRLDPGQTVAQWVTWAGLAGFGLFLVDFGDTEGSVGSVFSRALGNGAGVQTLSWLLAAASTALAVGGWVVLFVLLLRGRTAGAAVRGAR
jgi:hypothetical protein